MLYRIGDLQAVEPDALPTREGILVERHPDLDDMGFPRVDVVSNSPATLIAYVHEQWSGDEDPQWFAEYVVGRITEHHVDWAAYEAASREEQA